MTTSAGGPAGQLSRIAEEAARCVGGLAAAVLLVERDGALRVGGCWTATGRRHRWLQRRGVGVSLATTPLELGAAVVGALDVYRPPGRAWTAEDRRLLADCGAQAADAVRTAALAERQHRQSIGIERALRGLRSQTHEQANQLHAIGALVWLGAEADARQFVAELIAKQDEVTGASLGGIEEPILAGLLLGEIAAARELGVDFQVDAGSSLSQVPPTLTQAEWFALVGALLEYALAEAPDRASRRLMFAAREDGDDVVLSIGEPDRRPLPAGEAPAVCSAALSLLREAVSAAGGTLAIGHGGSRSEASVRLASGSARPVPRSRLARVSAPLRSGGAAEPSRALGAPA